MFVKQAIAKIKERTIAHKLVVSKATLCEIKKRIKDFAPNGSEPLTTLLSDAGDETRESMLFWHVDDAKALVVMFPKPTASQTIVPSGVNNHLGTDVRMSVATCDRDFFFDWLTVDGETFYDVVRAASVTAPEEPTLRIYRVGFEYTNGKDAPIAPMNAMYQKLAFCDPQPMVEIDHLDAVLMLRSTLAKYGVKLTDDHIATLSDDLLQKLNECGEGWTYRFASNCEGDYIEFMSSEGDVLSLVTTFDDRNTQIRDGYAIFTTDELTNAVDGRRWVSYSGTSYHTYDARGDKVDGILIFITYMKGGVTSTKVDAAPKVAAPQTQAPFNFADGAVIDIREFYGMLRFGETKELAVNTPLYVIRQLNMALRRYGTWLTEQQRVELLDRLQSKINSFDGKCTYRIATNCEGYRVEFISEDGDTVAVTVAFDYDNVEVREGSICFNSYVLSNVPDESRCVSYSGDIYPTYVSRKIWHATPNTGPESDNIRVFLTHLKVEVPKTTNPTQPTPVEDKETPTKPTVIVTTPIRGGGEKPEGELHPEYQRLKFTEWKKCLINDVGSIIHSIETAFQAQGHPMHPKRLDALAADLRTALAGFVGGIRCRSATNYVGFYVEFMSGTGEVVTLAVTIDTQWVRVGEGVVAFTMKTMTEILRSQTTVPLGSKSYDSGVFGPVVILSYAKLEMPTASASQVDAAKEGNSCFTPEQGHTVSQFLRGLSLAVGLSDAVKS